MGSIGVIFIESRYDYISQGDFEKILVRKLYIDISYLLVA